MDKVTVIIPNYNGKVLLENCIRSLEKQIYKEFMVLIIDNGSTDGSLELTSESLKMEIVSLPENKGFCGAVNIGIDKTRTPYLILLNNDTEAEPEFVGSLIKAVEGNKDIFSAGALMLDYKNHDIVDNAGDYYTAFGWAVSRGKGKKREAYKDVKRVFSSCGGAVIYQTKLLKDFGGFDEMHFAYLEDVDVGYRARIYGYHNVYEPKAVVYHVGSATTGTRYNEKKVFFAARNSIFLIYKNMPLLQALINLPLILAGVIIKMCFFLGKGLFRQYMKGILTGIAECHNCKKIPFQACHFGQYCQIQFELWINICRVVLKK